MTEPTIYKTKITKALEAAVTDGNYPVYHEGNPYALNREGWNLPEVTEALNRHAKAVLPAVEAELEPASIGIREKWLTSLGTLCAGKMSAADAKAKLSAYGSMMDYPSQVFTKATLGQAGREFKFFPSYAEVCEFLNAKAKPLLDRAERVRKIAEANVMLPGRPEQEPVEERRAHANRIMSELRAAVPVTGGSGE